MSLTDHVAILLHSSLDQARQNRVNKNKTEFYANVALPPSAGADLAALMTATSPNGSLNGLRLTIEPNGKKAKPHAGVPNDWLIVRMSSGADFPPDLFGEDGTKIPALPLHGTEIRTQFFSGQRVRLNGYPFYWTHAESGARGISWNLSGVMAVGGGERRAAAAGGEPSESVFAQYRSNTGTAPAPQDAYAAAAPAVYGTAAPAIADPFQAAAASSDANPFG